MRKSNKYLPSPILDIKFKRTVKYLGVMIDRSMILQDYTNKLIEKSRKAVNRAWILSDLTVLLAGRLELWKVFASSHFMYSAAIYLLASK